MSTAISFNSNSLQDDNIITESIDHHDAPDEEINMYNVAHANRRRATYGNVSSKRITVAGTIKSDSIEAFDSLVDTFKGYLTGIEKNLDIGYAGSTRRYIATKASVSIPRPGGLESSKFTVVFECSVPFGMDITPTQICSVSGATSFPAVTAMDVGGNVEFQYPIITVTINSGSGLTGATIVIGNNDNGQECSITRDWLAGDVITIDPYEQDVLVNGTEVEFTGSIPFFNKGDDRHIMIDTTITSANISYEVNHYRFWL